MIGHAGQVRAGKREIHLTLVSFNNDEAPPPCPPWSSARGLWRRLSSHHLLLSLLSFTESLSPFSSTLSLSIFEEAWPSAISGVGDSTTDIHLSSSFRGRRSGGPQFLSCSTIVVGGGARRVEGREPIALICCSLANPPVVLGVNQFLVAFSQ